MEPKSLMRYFKNILLFSAVSTLTLTQGCSKKTEADIDEAAVYSEENETVEVSTEAKSMETYPETVKAYGVNEEVSPYFGVMHAVLLDIQKDKTTGEVLYTFQDIKDPENAWAVPEIEIGSINTEMEKGNEVVLLFNGDIINESEEVEFISILPEDEYTIKRAEGVTDSNIMTSFKLITKEGNEIGFIKDNCLMEDGVMQENAGESVVVYYAESRTDGSNYPLKIYSK
ncbi:MAG: hypothetical protein Q4B86_05400 [Eubacteriales bacterium]|nr:hypothetical protein [Eubacteriales bacterium]